MRFCGCGRVPAYSNQPQHRSCAAAVSGPPNSEFAKIFELLNAFEQLDEQEQSAVLESANPANLPPGPTAVTDGVIASEPDVDNILAAHIAAAMAKRTRSP
jgi:hypothetical protein